MAAIATGSSRSVFHWQALSRTVDKAAPSSTLRAVYRSSTKSFRLAKPPRSAGRTPVSCSGSSRMDAARGQDGPWMAHLDQPRNGAGVSGPAAQRRAECPGQAFLVTLVRGAQPRLAKVTRPRGRNKKHQQNSMSDYGTKKAEPAGPKRWASLALNPTYKSPPNHPTQKLGTPPAIS